MSDKKLPPDLINTTIQYLASRPYAEVARLIDAWKQALPVEEPKEEKEEKEQKEEKKK